MHDSPVRIAPAVSLPAPWLYRANWTHLLVAVTPCVAPPLIAYGASLPLAFGATALLGGASATAALTASRRAASCHPGKPPSHLAALLVGLVAAADMIQAYALLPYATGTTPSFIPDQLCVSRTARPHGASSAPLLRGGHRYVFTSPATHRPSWQAMSASLPT